MSPSVARRSLFEAVAGFYAWMTAQSAWRQSCRGLAAHLPLEEHALRIVDLGCGPGVATLELAQYRPKDAISGVDIASRMLHHARARAAARALSAGRLTWIQADAAQLPFRTGSIDAVTGHSVLYLLPDPRPALRECLRVLRPGGRLVVMEPNDRPVRLRDIVRLSANPRFWLSMALWRPVSWLHGRYTRESLPAMLCGAGFTQCQVSETLSGLGLIASVSKA